MVVNRSCLASLRVAYRRLLTTSVFRAPEKLFMGA